MGSFFGHALPGSMFYVLGVWCAVHTFIRLIQCRQQGKQFYSTCSFYVKVSSRPCLKDISMEAIVKICLCALGIIVEFIGGMDSETYHFTSVGNSQHITMYFFFAMSGVMDILVVKKVAPVNADYALLITAFLIEGILFKFHVLNRTDLDVILHTLLVYTIFMTAFIFLLEASSRSTPVLPLARALLVMIQGSWFWSVGYILYNPLPTAVPWDQSGHKSLMVAVVCFSWHVAINLILLIMLGGGVSVCHRRHHLASEDYFLLPLKATEGGAHEISCQDAGNTGFKLSQDSNDGDDSDSSVSHYHPPQHSQTSM